MQDDAEPRERKRRARFARDIMRDQFGYRAWRLGEQPKKKPRPRSRGKLRFNEGANGKGGFAGKRPLTAAWDATSEGVIRIFGEKMWPALDKHIKKLASRSPRR